MAAAKALLLDVLTPAAYRHFDDAARRVRRAARPHRSAGTDLPGYVSAYGAKGAVVFSPVRIRDYRDFCRYDARYGPRPLAVPAQRRGVPAAVGEDGAVDAVGAAQRRRHRAGGGQPRSLRRGSVVLIGGITDERVDPRRPRLRRPAGADQRADGHDVGRRRRRRRAQRPHLCRLPGQAGTIGARARAPRAARRGVHPGATVHRSGVRRQPVRVRRRVARPAGDRRAVAAPPRLQGVRRRAGDLVPVRRRHLVRPVPRPGTHRRRHARERLLRCGHQGPVRLRGALRPAARRRSAMAIATPGSGTPRRGRSCASCSATTRR